MRILAGVICAVTFIGVFAVLLHTCRLSERLRIDLDHQRIAEGADNGRW